MATLLRALHAPKEGNSEAQYEDAFAHTPLDGETFTVAVADGASSAGFARDWACLLVRAFTDSAFPEGDTEAADAVAALGRDWRESVGGRATSWHAQEKLESGSAATLLVVTWDRAKGTWNARSVGDVCVFLVRGNRLRYAFPLTKARKFDDRPALVSTEAGARSPMPGVVRYIERFEAGDRFLLMTDALAAYFLAEFEAKRKPWNDLPETSEALGPWLKARRDDGRIKNDDVTLVDITV
jgi:hypothetical protein